MHVVKKKIQTTAVGFMSQDFRQLYKYFFQLQGIEIICRFNMKDNHLPLAGKIQWPTVLLHLEILEGFT